MTKKKATRSIVTTSTCIIAFLLLFNDVKCNLDEYDDDTYATIPNDDYRLDEKSNFEYKTDPTNEKKNVTLIPTYVSLKERALINAVKLSNIIFGKRNTGNKTGNQIITIPIKIVGKTVGQVLDSIGLTNVNAIFPGTEWCGAGNRSSNIDEVGIFNNTDSCCREHDLCNVNINAGESRYGLLNNGIFTRSHCTCDENFYKCLKNVRSLVSRKVGITYFDVLRPQCFKEDYPATCADGSWIFKKIIPKKCAKYKYDKTQLKKWQWFDNPNFINL